MIRRLLQFRVQARQPGIVERKPARSDQAEKRKRDSGRNSSGFRPQQPCPTHAHFRSPCLNSVYLDPPEPMLEPPPEPPVPLVVRIVCGSLTVQIGRASCRERVCKYV